MREKLKSTDRLGKSGGPGFSTKGPGPKFREFGAEGRSTFPGPQALFGGQSKGCLWPKREFGAETRSTGFSKSLRGQGHIFEEN